MIRLAIDSDVLPGVAGRFPLIFTYSDLVPDYAAFAARYPSSEVVLIDRGLGDPTGLASVIDVETGARAPQDIPGWVRDKTSRDIRWLMVYCNRSNLDACRAAVRDRSVYWWVATLDGTLAIPPSMPLAGPTMVQFAGENLTGVHCDVSLVLDEHYRPSRITGPVAGAQQDLTDLAGYLADAGRELARVRDFIDSL